MVVGRFLLDVVRQALSATQKQGRRHTPAYSENGSYLEGPVFHYIRTYAILECRRRQLRIAVPTLARYAPCRMEFHTLSTTPLDSAARRTRPVTICGHYRMEFSKDWHVTNSGFGVHLPNTYVFAFRASSTSLSSSSLLQYLQ